ncbi:MAG: response regulator, partial [Schaedlerella sp.]|uniref:response regulator n=1 Tax=Schaedlerella sp. TaxID=2676057 RepID=UPI0035293196
MNRKEQKLIMILEDDEDLAEGIALSLQGEELNFEICRTISEARDVLKKKEFDLLIFDINLPDGSVLELCREVRHMGKVPIALLT